MTKRNKSEPPATEIKGSDLVLYGQKYDLIALEKKELRLQRKLYSLLLVITIGFGGLAAVMYQMVVAFRLDMDGMRADMDRMAPAIIFMSNTMTNLSGYIFTMTADVSGMRSGVDAINRQFWMMNQSVDSMGRDVNRIGHPMRMFLP